MWEAFDNSLRDLPIRRINFEDARERWTHDDIVRLVKDIEKAIAEARCRPAQDSAQRAAAHLPLRGSNSATTLPNRTRRPAETAYIPVSG